MLLRICFSVITLENRKWLQYCFGTGPTAEHGPFGLYMVEHLDSGVSEDICETRVLETKGIRNDTRLWVDRVLELKP